MSEATSFEQFAQRPLPSWFEENLFGIFIHWGAYSVAGWAEPIGALGTIDWDTWFRHNPYSEWYANTIRIDGSPAQQHHRDTYGDMPYDGLLDLWLAELYDPADWAALFRRAGAGYVVPTTKHHDGIALWDAPSSEGRNTVARGPKRDLIEPLAEAVRAEGMHFGAYYSGGLDWDQRPFPPHRHDIDVHDTFRPKDAEYGAYCALQCRDLIDRYQPEVLWNDIEWPDDAKNFDEGGLGTLFNYFYSQVPTGVVNDRYGDTHADYLTSEYSDGLENEKAAGAWENCRGIGYSFAYNQLEDTAHYLSGYDLARMLTDIVSRGGHLLLNVGPKADGTLPDEQRQALEDLGLWMDTAREVLFGSRPAATDDVVAEDSVWVRGVQRDGFRTLFVDLEATDREVGAKARL
ncbi:alpha-L-fucosidase, partial [Corynebacterium variabile]|uniref:alpha-L-fucosidase n=1 Tax=Corynebacterium variabile TaxID=1727 RepID=UPI003BB1D7BD